MACGKQVGQCGVVRYGVVWSFMVMSHDDGQAGRSCKCDDSPRGRWAEQGEKRMARAQPTGSYRIGTRWSAARWGVLLRPDQIRSGT